MSGIQSSASDIDVDLGRLFGSLAVRWKRILFVALAVTALALAFFALRARYLEPLASAINLSSVRFLPVELCLLLVVGGMLVGCVGGAVAAWRS
jgi:hypothetical protein